MISTWWPPLASDKGRTWRRLRRELLRGCNHAIAVSLVVRAVFLRIVRWLFFYDEMDAGNEDEVRIIFMWEKKYYCRSTFEQLFLMGKSSLSSWWYCRKKGEASLESFCSKDISMVSKLISWRQDNMKRQLQSFKFGYFWKRNSLMLIG